MAVSRQLLTACVWGTALDAGGSGSVRPTRSQINEVIWLCCFLEESEVAGEGDPWWGSLRAGRRVLLRRW